MQVRHYIVLFDIDETLIDFHSSSKVAAVWNGRVELWREYISLLKGSLNTDKTRIHIGIATSKPKHITAANAELNVVGDILSAAVLEDEMYIEHCSTVSGIGRNLGIREFINDKLVFFTNGTCKIQNALDLVEGIVEAQHKKNGTHLIERKNIMLIDDSRFTCGQAIANGYQAICVDGLSKLDRAECEAQIGKIFLSIYEKFNLPIPAKMLYASEVIVECKDEKEMVENLSEELTNYMCAAEESAIKKLERWRIAKSQIEKKPDYYKSKTKSKLDFIREQRIGFFLKKVRFTPTIQRSITRQSFK